MGIGSVDQQSYYINQMKNNQQNNFTLANSSSGAPVFNSSVQQPVVDTFNGRMVLPADGKDDGSIGLGGAVKNMVKGVGNFFKGMFFDEGGKFSLTRTLTTIGMGVAIGAACAFLPTIAIAGTTFSTLGLISAGFLGFAGLHAGSAALDIMDAKTDAEAEQAWQSMGSALTEGGLAYLGYRAAGGIRVKNTAPTSPSGSTPKTPKTPKTESTSETPVRTSTPKSESVVEESVVEETGIFGRKDGLKLENVPKEYIGPKEFNPADYATADDIPGMRFGDSNVNIKQYNSEGLSIRLLHAYDNVHVTEVTDFKPGTTEVVKQTNYRRDGKTLESLRDYAKGEKSKTTYYKEDGKTIDAVSDHTTNTKYKYKYKEDGVTIDSVLVYKNKSLTPSSVIKYENGKAGKELPCDMFGKPIEEAPLEVAQPEVKTKPKVETAIVEPKTLQESISNYKSTVQSENAQTCPQIDEMLNSLVEHNYANDESVVGIMTRTLNKDYHGRAVDVKDNTVIERRLVRGGKDGVKQAPDSKGDYLIQTLDDGRKIVSIVVDTGRKDFCGRPIRSRLTVVSKNNEFTPMQKDLIKIISQRKNKTTNEPDILSIGAIAPDNGLMLLDKDVLLSSIATALKQLKPEEINMEFVNRALSGDRIAKCEVA